MSDLDSLDSVLGDDEGTGNLPLETPTNETPGDDVDTDAPPAPEAQPTDEPDGDKPKAEPEESWTKQAVLDERRKRQAAERELQELRSKQSPSKPAPEKPERPDVFADPDGAFRHVESSFQSRLVENQIVLSQELMRERHDDYDEKEQLFEGLAKDNPALVQQMLKHPLPAKFVYETVNKHLQQQEFQDPEAYKAKVRAEVLAELNAESDNDDSKPESKPSPGPSLIKQRSAGRNPVVQESLADILGR